VPVGGARSAALARLVGGRFDLLVVGGGIVGAGVAELAARHGLAVALVERDDFGSGTSSASSKLVHGGLRYLRSGRFGLVREALGEVRALSGVVAPHLVRRLRFVLPIYRGGPYGRVPIRGALWSYAGLTGAVSERGRPVGRRCPPAREVVYARDREWALTVDDVLRRRTTVTLSGRASAAVRARVEELLRS
jgi:glycerol-3-phosphate dehydrogenase